MRKIVVKRLKIALIGAGQIARVTHLPNLKKMEEVDLVGICDVNQAAAKELAHQFQIPNYYDSHHKLLHETKPDAVLVCVPNCFHYAVTIASLQAGCHVLCEKPPALTSDEAKKMEQCANEQERLLSYGFHFRHSIEVQLLKEKIDRGEMGTIYGGTVSWRRRRGIPGWGNFTNKSIQGGGPLIDIGAHFLDLTCYLLDYPKISYVCANQNNRLGKMAAAGLMGSWDREQFTVEDSLFGYIQFENGSSINVDCAFAINQKEKDYQKILLYGERLGASVFPLALYGEENGVVIDQEYPYLPARDRHFDCVRNFVRACLNEETLLITARSGCYLQEVICALYQSAATKKPVML
jgi:predicted dehydrogenase